MDAHFMRQTMRRGAAEERTKRATNVSPSKPLLADAKTLGVNISQACERGLANAVREARAARWQIDNVEGVTAWNEYVERNGVPLAKYRKF